MLRFIKRAYWDLRDAGGRFEYLCAFLRNFPGKTGMELRAAYLPRYFAACGKEIKIWDGVRFRGVQNLRVGDKVEIGVDNFLQATAGITLGDGVMLGPSVKIWTVNHRFEDLDLPISDQGYNYGPVVIGDGCWLGANVFIMPGVTLPEGCVVSAGSVVGQKNYPPYSLLAGHPARVIGHRARPDTPPDAPPPPTSPS